jgi:hypothetical protein
MPYIPIKSSGQLNISAPAVFGGKRENPLASRFIIWNNSSLATPISFV